MTCENISMAHNEPPNGRPPHYVKEWRKHRGLTQERLALRVEKTQSWLSQLEQFKIEYTQGALEALGNALSCEPGDLLTVNPLKEGEVIDFTALLRGAPKTIKKQAYAIVETLLQTGSGNTPALYRPDDSEPLKSATKGGRT